VLVRAILEAEAAESSEVTAEHFEEAFSDFIPPANSREREMQILCAVLECTSRELLPQKFKDVDRGDVQARVAEIKRELAPERSRAGQVWPRRTSTEGTTCDSRCSNGWQQRVGRFPVRCSHWSSPAPACSSS
jgi:hypothetical protein